MHLFSFCPDKAASLKGGNAEKLRLMPIFASAFNACHLCYYGGSQTRQLQTMNDSKTHDRCINSKSWFNPALGVDKIFACSSTLLFLPDLKKGSGEGLPRHEQQSQQYETSVDGAGVAAGSALPLSETNRGARRCGTTCTQTAAQSGF